MSDRLSKIRNFCIIAHIDHGKSTLADRILETTGVFQKREMVEQILDSMELERERGITIKSKAVHMHYTAKDGKTYTLNLIDTPGHVDFTYEVSRALAACEGALLVVDATQGIEAQTLANCYMALDHDLEIIPVINKIDLPSAQPEEVRQEIEDVIGLDASYAPCVSAKTGLNIDQVLEAVVNYVPAPQGDENAPLQALIFDAFYDNYRGAICFIRVKQGTIRTGMRMRMMATGGEFDIVEVGTFAPSYQPCDELKAGDVGYVAASIKDVRETRVGDTITDAMNPADSPLPGYRQVTPMVYCGVYPADGADYPALKDALEKLRMNDASLFLTRNVRRTRLRLPLRLLGAAAHGHHHRAAGARMGLEPRHHRAERHLPYHENRRHGADVRQPDGAAAHWRNCHDGGTVRPRGNLHAAGQRRHDYGLVPRSARHLP